MVKSKILSQPVNLMPNPWTGVGNPCTRQEVIDRLHDTLSRGEAIISRSIADKSSLKQE